VQWLLAWSLCAAGGVSLAGLGWWMRLCFAGSHCSMKLGCLMFNSAPLSWRDTLKSTRYAVHAFC